MTHTFAHQDPDEEIVLFLRRHWMHFLGPASSLLIMFLLPIIFFATGGSFFPDLLAAPFLTAVFLAAVFFFTVVFFLAAGFFRDAVFLVVVFFFTGAIASSLS